MAPRLSLNLIVKNEAEHLPRVLSTARTYADEIVVVDTGSADETRALALRLADHVADFPWVDDFAAARNFAAGQCSGEFLMTLDADDVVPAEDAANLRTLMRHEVAWDLCRVPYVLSPDGRGRVNMYARIWRAGAGIRWVYPIHEVLEGDGRPVRTHWLREGVRVFHRPEPLPARDAARRARNRRIFERVLATEEYGRSGHLWWHLAKECVRDDPPRGLEAVRRAMELNPARGTFLRSRQQYLAARMLRTLGRTDDAREVLGQAIAEYPHWREPWWMLAKLHAEQERPGHARLLMEAAGRIARHRLDVERAELYGPEWSLEVSDVLEACGDRAEALHEVREALRRAPETAALAVREIELRMRAGETAAPGIERIDAEPAAVGPGETFSARFSLRSESTLRVVLGLSLRGADGRVVSDPPDDDVVALDPGTCIRERRFAVPSDMVPGKCDLLASLRLEQDGVRGRPVARFSRASAVEIRAR